MFSCARGVFSPTKFYDLAVEKILVGVKCDVFRLLLLLVRDIFLGEFTLFCDRLSSGGAYLVFSCSASNWDPGLEDFALELCSSARFAKTVSSQSACDCTIA